MTDIITILENIKDAVKHLGNENKTSWQWISKKDFVECTIQDINFVQNLLLKKEEAKKNEDL